MNEKVIKRLICCVMVEKLRGKCEYISFRPESSHKVAVFGEMHLHLPTFYAFDFLSNSSS